MRIVFLSFFDRTVYTAVVRMSDCLLLSMSMRQPAMYGSFPSPIHASVISGFDGGPYVL